MTEDQKKIIRKTVRWYRKNFTPPTDSKKMKAERIRMDFDFIVTEASIAITTKHASDKTPTGYGTREGLKTAIRKYIKEKYL